MKVKHLIVLISFLCVGGVIIGCSADIEENNCTKTKIETEKSNEYNIVQSDTEEYLLEDEYSIEVVDGFESISYVTEVPDDIWVMDDSGIEHSFTSQQIEATMSKYPETAEKIENFFVNHNIEMYMKSKEETEYEGYAMTYQMNIEKERIDDTVISFLYGGNYWRGSGTEYNNSYYEGVTFALDTGTRLKLEDVVYNVEDFRKMAVSYIALSLWEELCALDNPYMYQGYGSLPEFTDEFEDYNWFFDENGLAVICNPSGKYCRTVIDRNFVIPYEKLSGYLKEEYIPEGIVASERENAEYADLLDVLYAGVTTDEAASRSGLDIKMTFSDGEVNVYEACEGKVEFTSCGSSPGSIDIIMTHPVDGVSIGGCTIGMSISDCIASLEQNGFYVANRDDYNNRCIMLHDGEWKEIDFKTLNGVVVEIRYGVYYFDSDYEMIKEWIAEE